MRLFVAVALIALVGCSKKPVEPAAIDAGRDAGLSPREVKWPTDVTADVHAITIHRYRGEEPARMAKLERGEGGLWRMTSPFRGEADPDAVAALLFAVRAPQVTRAARAGIIGKDALPTAFDIDFGDGNRIATYQVPLGAEVPVQLFGFGSTGVNYGQFLVAPTEFAQKIPDPSDFAPPGLWVSAAQTATSLEVSGPAKYRLVREGDEWKALGDKRKSVYDLEDFAGVITGRTAIDHKPASAIPELGLDKPIATAKLCTNASTDGGTGECREFRFSRVRGKDGEHLYGIGPDSDPIEMHAPDWTLLVNGPFAGRHK